MFRKLGAIKNFILILIAKITNYAYYQKGLISPFHYKLKKLFLKKNQQFGVNNFYQSYPPLLISGIRPTASRFGNYGLGSLINEQTEILDIGGNIGFFSAYVSRFVQHIDLVEQNPDLIAIGSQLLRYENIHNVQLIHEDFKKFQTQKKYDVIFAFAIHNWVGMEFEDYLEKIYSHTKNGGCIILETHIFTYNDSHCESLDDKIHEFGKYTIVTKGISDDQEGQYREFFILQK